MSAQPNDSSSQTLSQGSKMRALTWFAGVIAALLLLWFLHQTLWVTMPLLAAFFIALALWPVHHSISKRMPRHFKWVGYAGAMSIYLLAIGLFIGGVWYGSSEVAERAPQYMDEYRSLENRFSGWIEGFAPGRGNGQDAQTQRSDAVGSAGLAAAMQNGSKRGNSNASGTSDTAQNGQSNPVRAFALKVLESLGKLASSLTLIFFFVLLMLIEGRTWCSKLVEVTRRQDSDKWKEALADIAHGFRWYILLRALLGFITALLYALWLFVWGIEFIYIWAFLTFVLNFVPTVGSLISGLLPVAFAFLQKDLTTALIVGVGILVIEQIMGNYVDPRMQGKRLSLSSLIVLFMLLLWGWVWGVAGALLAIPMTLLLMMTFLRIEPLIPLGVFLSDEPDSNKLIRQLDQQH